MAELDNYNRLGTRDHGLVRLAPGVDEGGGKDITTSQVFGPFAAGDYVTMSTNKDFFFRTGAAENIEADASCTPATAGAHDYTVPTGVTYVAIFSAETDARGACWKS